MEYDEWGRRHRVANVLLQGRACELDRLYEEMEQDLELLGVTAIEDKLQEGVPETIQLLKLGNIKVWVLTGDKQETAMNVGYACKLLTDDMEILEEKEASEIFKAYWARNNVSGSACVSQQHSEPLCHKKRALVVSGDFLERCCRRRDSCGSSCLAMGRRTHRSRAVWWRRPLWTWPPAARLSSAAGSPPSRKLSSCSW